MKKGNKLFVRIDYRNEKKDFESSDFEDHIEYWRGLQKKGFFWVVVLRKRMVE